jgi:5-methyltetrahydropteroyltriglutamate--homocysteine methyltransferase
MGSRNGKPFFRAEMVGSLLRPPRLLEARDRFGRGEISRAELWDIENDAIGEAAKLQEEIGFEVVTDGEFRRSVWWFDFINALGGIEIREPDKRSGFSGVGSGEWEYYPKTVRTVAKLSRAGDIMAPEYKALVQRTSKTGKVTIPSPSRIHFHGGRASVSRTVYPDTEEFWADVVEIYRGEIAALEAAGCRYVQIDDPMLTYFLDERLRANVCEIGEDPDRLIRKYVEVLNACVSKRRSDTAVGVHLCRGNSRSTWMAEGSYERIAETVFGGLDFDAFFLEYDDPRSGGFEPLRFLPKGKIAVLGLITTKRPDLERRDEIERRIDAAARFVSRTDLAISPQCGFASNVEGNIITFDDQVRKLELVVSTAREVWGTA